MVDIYSIRECESEGECDKCGQEGYYKRRRWWRETVIRVGVGVGLQQI
jgi:hypothetical protein